MFEKALILGLYSITPVHAGSGAEMSVIDLPIQRERHTGFPVVWGQSLKGVLRSRFRRLEFEKQIKIYDKNWDWEQKTKELLGDKVEEFIKKVRDGKRDPILTEAVFGPATEGASEHAGAISVGDAKILLFPVRSAKGVFAYVTCPMVLERFVRDVELVAEISSNDRIKQTISNSKIRSVEISGEETIAGKILVLDDGKVVLEDVVLTASSNSNILDSIVELLKAVFGERKNGDEHLFGKPVDHIKRHLAVVSDDVFKSFTKFSTEIVARVRIDAESGTVAQGGLWYEEFLPSDTLMYSVIAVGEPRRKSVPKEANSASEIFDLLKDNFNDTYLQIGGDETVGKGFVKVITGDLDGSENS